MSERRSRRLLVVGVLAGAAIGTTLGVTSLTGAGPGRTVGIRPVVLHVAKVVADPGAELELTAGVVCPQRTPPACAVASAVAHVLSAGTVGWTDVAGVSDGTSFRFVIPGALVPAEGLSYWLELAIEGGAAVRLPEAGPAAPFRVLTTAGLPQVPWPGRFDWGALTPADGVIARLAYGGGDDEVGRVGGPGTSRRSGPRASTSRRTVRSTWPTGSMLVCCACPRRAWSGERPRSRCRERSTSRSAPTGVWP